MKVLQINAVYGHGSTGTIVRDIEKLCEKSGIESYVASPDPEVAKAKRGYRIGNKLDHKLHALLGRINGKQAYFSKYTTGQLIKWIESVKPDIVHLHNLHSNYIYLNMLLEYLADSNTRTLITLHDCWYFTGGCFHYTSSGCYKWMDECGNCPRKKFDTPSYFLDCSSEILADRAKYLNKIPNLYIIGASEWVANECRKSVLTNCQIGYIHNGFNLNTFRPVQSKLREKYGLEGKFVMLAPASKWYAEVNKDTLNYFVSNLDEDMALVLFGCSNPRADLPKNVIEIGYINNPEEMAELYSMADVFVNCTREDTFPSVNIESQATGTPVVTYDATGCKETVDGHCGKSVTAGDYAALFNAVKEIKEIGKSSLTEQCVKWVKAHFELNNSYRKYIELYKSICNCPKNL